MTTKQILKVCKDCKCNSCLNKQCKESVCFVCEMSYPIEECQGYVSEDK